MFDGTILFFALALSCCADPNEILQKTLQFNTFGYISCPLDNDDVSWVKLSVQPGGNYTEIPIVSSTRDPSLQQPASTPASTPASASASEITTASGVTILWKNHLMFLPLTHEDAQLYKCNNGSHDATFNVTVITEVPRPIDDLMCTSHCAICDHGFPCKLSCSYEPASDWPGFEPNPQEVYKSETWADTATEVSFFLCAL